jgi:hypothetical protein
MLRRRGDPRPGIRWLRCRCIFPRKWHIERSTGAYVFLQETDHQLFDRDPRRRRRDLELSMEVCRNPSNDEIAGLSPCPSHTTLLISMPHSIHHALSICNVTFARSVRRACSFRSTSHWEQSLCPSLRRLWPVPLWSYWRWCCGGGMASVVGKDTPAASAVLSGAARGPARYHTADRHAWRAGEGRERRAGTAALMHRRAGGPARRRDPSAGAQWLTPDWSYRYG